MLVFAPTFGVSTIRALCQKKRRHWLDRQMYEEISDVGEERAAASSRWKYRSVTVASEVKALGDVLPFPLICFVLH